SLTVVEHIGRGNRRRVASAKQQLLLHLDRHQLGVPLRPEPGYDTTHENYLFDVFHKLRFKSYGERDIRQWAERQDCDLTGCLNDPPRQFDRGIVLLDFAFWRAQFDVPEAPLAVHFRRVVQPSSDQRLCGTKVDRNLWSSGHLE